jgi:protein TonB
MSPPPRSLTFAVSTSLLTASLALAGCDEPKKQINPGPVNEAPKPEPDHVNVGPEPQPPEPPPPEPIHVNEGPEPQPEPVVKSVNPGPEPEEPKRVNTQPEK